MAFAWFKMLVTPWDNSWVACNTFNPLVCLSSPLLKSKKLPAPSFILSFKVLPICMPNSPTLPFTLSNSLSTIPPLAIFIFTCACMPPAFSISCSICGINGLTPSDISKFWIRFKTSS